MRILRTVIFILVFVLAAAVYLYQANLAKQFVANVPDEVNRNVTLSPEDEIDRIALRDHAQKTQIDLRKESGAWILEVPVRYPAESRVVDGLVATARMVSRQPRLRAEKEWEEYGLERPDMEITFGLPEERSVTLLLGATAPVGRAIYARWTDERGYFLLSPEVKSVFRQSVYGLRDKRIFRAPTDAYRKITVEMGEHSYQWKKDGPPEKQDEARPSPEGGSDWYWFEPVSLFGQKVPPDQVRAVKEALRSLHVKEFQDNNRKSSAELGFFMIHDRIRVESDDSGVENFHFGNEIPDRNAYYGLREGEATVFLVDRGKVIELFDLMKNIEEEDGRRKAEDVTTEAPSAILHPPSRVL